MSFRFQCICSSNGEPRLNGPATSTIELVAKCGCTSEGSELLAPRSQSGGLPVRKRLAKHRTTHLVRCRLREQAEGWPGVAPAEPVGFQRLERAAPPNGPPGRKPRFVLYGHAPRNLAACQNGGLSNRGSASLNFSGTPPGT